MNTKVIFNTDKKLKAAAMRKARKQGLTYSAVLNFATRAYVNDVLKIDVLGEIINKARKDIRAGKGIPQEEVFKRLGL
jgi:antitoxin component of RelBE/YafQ-DinJ toxin-antitoxin module